MGARSGRRPAEGGDTGFAPLTINKVRAMNSLSQFSSQTPGHDAAYAVDNSSGTWWEPATNDTRPTLTIDLSPATRFDVVELFTIDSMRLMFNSGGRGGGGGRGGFGAGGRGGGRGGASATPYQYKLEASTDGARLHHRARPKHKYSCPQHALR